jgi:PIN domain nuclease of toxin-antitoxin system
MIYVTDTYPLTLHIRDRHDKLGKQARRVYDQVVQKKATIVIPTICLVEIMELAEVRKLKLDSSLKAIIHMLKGSRVYQLEPLTEDVVLTASTIPIIREERDRLIVATALTLDYQFITNDRFITESGIVETIWD